MSDSLRPHGSLPGFSVHGILQARILEWVAIPLSRGSSQPRDQTRVSCICRQSLYHLRYQGSPTREERNATKNITICPFCGMPAVGFTSCHTLYSSSPPCKTRYYYYPHYSIISCWCFYRGKKKTKYLASIFLSILHFPSRWHFGTSFGLILNPRIWQNAFNLWCM